MRKEILGTSRLLMAVIALWGSPTRAAEPAPAGEIAVPCKSARLDRKVLEEAARWIEAGETHIESFVVRHCGEVVFERYYNGFKAEARHDMQSATKTFTAALIGIALKEGLIDSLDQPVAELLPDYRQLLQGAKAQITLRHLLTMTSGLKWTDFGPERSFEFMAAAKDSVAYVLGEPLVSQPGQTFFYNTGSSHLLSAIITARSGKPAAEYAREKLFGPLGIADYVWRAHADGQSEGGWQLYLRPKDAAKFGQLLLDEGEWQGRQLIAREYVDEATRGHNPTDYGSEYGFQMWIEKNFGIADVAAARGWAGQDIFVLDEMDMVVVFNGDIAYPAEMARDVRHIMTTFIARSVQPAE